MATVSKDESLRILASLGVHYPDNTKFASEILAEKLTRAIDIAQRAQANVPKRIDPGRITKWKKGNNASFKELMQVFQECSIEECGQNLMRELATGDRNPPLFSDVFTDIRQTLLTIVNHYAGPDKRKLFLVQDAEENYSITFRVLGIHILDNKTPLISVLYGHGPGPGVDRAARFLMRTDAYPTITATLLEQKLLLKILEQNSRRLAASFKPERHFSENSYTPSFLLPLRVLSMESIGSLTKSGCSRCGVPAVSRCSACQSAAYCGKECQMADWKEHKKMCKPLSKGVWQAVRFSPPDIPLKDEGKDKFMILFNRNGMPSELSAQKVGDADGGPPPNVHGSDPFFIKIQVPLMDLGFDEDHVMSGIMVYDRRRTFVGYIHRQADPSVYARIDALVRAKGVGGLKIYRWAKRVADWTLDICLDAEPNEPMQW